MESPDLVRLECAYDGVQHAAVMEQDEVFLVPVVGVDELWRLSICQLEVHMDLTG